MYICTITHKQRHIKLTLSYSNVPKAMTNTGSCIYLFNIEPYIKYRDKKEKHLHTEYTLNKPPNPFAALTLSRRLAD